MSVGDLIFYLLDAVILYMLYRMRENSRRIQIRTSLGPRWVIPGMFWAVAALGFFNYTGSFRWIQTIMLGAMGVIFWQMDSGLSPKGVVMMGRLYPWEKCMPITVEEDTHCINITLRRLATPIFFLPEQMKDVRAYIAKHSTRRANRSKTGSGPRKTAKKTPAGKK